MKSVEELISGIENGEVEFKQQPNTAMYKTLSAFSNTNGGIILVGVSDAGEIVGYRCENNFLKELSDLVIRDMFTRTGTGKGTRYHLAGNFKPRALSGDGV